MRPQPKYTTFPAQRGIQQALGVRKFKPNGFSSRNVRCPFHDDKHPSASLHNQKGLYCHACARWYTWKALAGKLGIEWVVSGGSQRVERTSKYLTDEVIQKLVARKRVRACQILSELFRLELAGEVVTVKTVMNLGCSKETVLRMAKEGQLNFVDSLPTYYNIQEVGKHPTKFKRGRKQKSVRVPILSELEDLLGCDGSRRGYLIEVTEDRVELKAEAMALPVKRAPHRTAQLPTSYLKKAAGVKSPKTVRKYMRMVTDIEPDVTVEPFTVAEFDAMPESESDYFAERQRAWKYLQVGESKFAYNKGQAILAMHIAGKLEGVSVVTQRANIYHYRGMATSPEVQEFIDILQTAIVTRQPRKREWARLMDDLDTKIQMQKEREKRWRTA